MKTTNFIILFALAFTSTSLDMVNTQLGSWEWTTKVIDLEIKYHSQSLYQGWFGQGWCSTIDVEIDFSSTKPRFKKCGRLSSNEKLRIHDHGFQIVEDDYEYIFNHLGQLTLIKLFAKPHSPIAVEWKEQKPRSIAMRGQTWALELSNKGKWISQIASKIKSFQFKYTKDQLAQIQALDKDGRHTEILVSFSYDAHSNMNFIVTPLRKVRLVYDRLNDRILEVQLNNGCSTKYSYSESKLKNEISLVTSIHKQCRNDVLGRRQIISEFDLTDNSYAHLKTIKEVSL